MKERVKEILDSSLSQIEIDPAGSFMTVARFPNNIWQRTCEETTTTFTCRVQLARLKVVIYITEPVSCILKRVLKAIVLDLNFNKSIKN